MNRIYNCTGHQQMIDNVVSADGAYLMDDQGKRYMDLESGVWCTSLGHNHPSVNTAMKRQMDAITHVGFCYSNDILLDAAASVLSVTGMENGKCVFLCSGSEVIELARQITRHLTKKRTTMTLHDAYLGSYSAVIDRSADWYSFDWTACPNCDDKENCRIDCDKLKQIPDDVSDFVFEPGSASGFVRFPPEKLIENIVSIVREKGGKIIVNDVTTGVGRTGKWFGYQHYSIKPDMVAIGKGIGNGYPVSVTAMSEQMAKELNGSGFTYMQSHQNDPLGAAVVHEVIQSLQKDDLITRAAENGQKFYDMLHALIDDDLVSDVRGRGLMFAVDFKNTEVAETIFNRLIDAGYIVCFRGTYFRIDPPLILTLDEFAEFVDAFKKILKSIV